MIFVLAMVRADAMLFINDEYVLSVGESRYGKE
jgi:hypothetical protein